MAKKIGLALGAGGSRGFAHIGVLNAFEENGIKIDCISGTSMGAAIGGMYASGCDMKMMPAFLNTINEKILMDYKIPKLGMIGGEKYLELLRLFTKQKNIEDLDIKFSCVACDIINAKSKVFTKGKLYKAIRCSISIPGVFEPYKYNGKMYVDGAVIDRVPVQSCRDLGADIVIGVDVGYKGSENEVPKNLIDIMMTTFDIMGWETTKHKISTADYMLMPDVSFVNQYKCSDSDKCIQIGYDVAMKFMPTIKELIK